MTERGAMWAGSALGGLVFLAVALPVTVAVVPPLWALVPLGIGAWAFYTAGSYIGPRAVLLYRLLRLVRRSRKARRDLQAFGPLSPRIRVGQEEEKTIPGGSWR
jgi:hypothetical protein